MLNQESGLDGHKHPARFFNKKMLPLSPKFAMN